MLIDHLYTQAVYKSHLEYASSVWDPHLVKDITALEDCQKFALRICIGCWDTPYSELLDVMSFAFTSGSIIGTTCT